MLEGTKSEPRAVGNDSGLDEFIATLKYMVRDSRDLFIESTESGAMRVPDGGYILRATYDIEVYLPNSDRVDACLRWLRGEKPDPVEENPVADGAQLSLVDLGEGVRSGLIDVEVGGSEEDEAPLNF